MRLCAFQWPTRKPNDLSFTTSPSIASSRATQKLNATNDRLNAAYCNVWTWGALWNCHDSSCASFWLVPNTMKVDRSQSPLPSRLFVTRAVTRLGCLDWCLHHSLGRASSLQQPRDSLATRRELNLEGRRTKLSRRWTVVVSLCTILTLPFRYWSSGLINCDCLLGRCVHWLIQMFSSNRAFINHHHK